MVIVLSKSPVLTETDFSKSFHLYTDALGVALGGVLVQEKEGVENPVTFLSQNMYTHEKACSTIEKELLVIKWAVTSLQYYLLCNPFILITDHAALEWLKDKGNHNEEFRGGCCPCSLHVPHLALTKEVTYQCGFSGPVAIDQ